MRAYERFLNYVRVHTTSDEKSGKHPSFDGEFNLANILCEELKKIGLEEVSVDEHCYVYGRIPATKGYEKCPVLGFIAHMDTSPDASGLNVSPRIIENYDGSDIILPATGDVLSIGRFPFLKDFIGKKVITSDGSTLLGADDKAGIAEIISAAEQVINSSCPHGEIKVAFTPDEEIGEGSDFFDIKGFGADYAYTVDGGAVECFEYENFNAASAQITVKGISVHPGSAKGIMHNAARIALEFDEMLPAKERPEFTENREGFYHLTDMKGDVNEAALSYIIRDHDRNSFEARKAMILSITGKLNVKYGEGTVNASVKDSYYNMLEKILPHMHLVENAHKAIQDAGLKPVDVPVRGGTDGARLSYDGLPCPNLGTGGYNYHGNLECIACEDMDKAVEIITNLIYIYANL